MENMEMLVRKPKVSVCVITYNQEQFIRQCLQSIVDQKTDFNFEIIVGDDCSTDGTRVIVQEFAEKYPKMIRTIFQEKNTGGSKNNLDVHTAAIGEYVAIVDGDDYILPGKLQAQVECLEANQDVSFAVHAVRIIDTDKLIGSNPRYPIYGTVHDLLRLGTYFVNSSVMYRKVYEFLHPTDFEAIDYYMHIERATKGLVYLDRRVLGCYRVHNQGISKNLHKRDATERFYEAAFDRAIELGVENKIVQAARIKRRMAFAIARYLLGDIAGYKEKIRLAKEDIRFASIKHILLHSTTCFPWLVGIYFRLKLILPTTD